MSSVFSLFLAPFRHRTLLYQFTRREIAARYRGSLMGFAWAFVTPLLMLGVYSFVFIGVFGARWPGAEQAGGFAYALRLFCGMAVFSLFAEVVSQAPNLVTNQPNLVKKVVFPLELLPSISLCTASFHFAISLGILLGFTAVLEGLSLRLLLFPLVLLPLLPLLLGMSWLLSALGVFVRDIAQVTGIFVTFMMFLSPVFYSTATLKEGFRSLMFFNPLTGPIENMRALLFTTTAPDWGSWAYSMAFGLIVALLGAILFLRTREGFADVL